ncbi:MAG: hypothetical protein ACYTG0_44470 [Planctomycetota bacterium]|jgi:hypothetical protein
MTTLLFARRDLSVFGRRAFPLVLIVSLAVVLACFCAAENCLAATEAEPVAKQPAVPPPASNNNASRQLLDEFRQTYALPDGQAVKRVSPPFSPGRLEYYRVYHAAQAKSIPEGPEFMWFKWDRRKPNPPPINWSRRHEGRLSTGGMGWVGGKGVSVAGLVDTFTGIHSYEMQGDRKLKWTRLPGDWVVRDGVPAERMLQGLGAVLREECKVPVRFRLAEADHQVILAEGTYTYQPMPGRSTVTEDHKYGYEGSDLQDYDQLEIFQHDRNGLTQVQSGTLDKLLSFLTECVDCPVIDGGIKLPADMTSRKPSEREHLLEWRSREWWKYRDALEKGTLDTAAILKHLSEQTGLTFSERTRRTRVLLIERAE